ncbi:MAG: phosphotransferase family protein [Blastocatellia bacterium]|nr:phosphotransferase family protein [Blastocatellia bacterium]
MFEELGDVRHGEELELDALAEYLRQRLPTPFERVEARQFLGGSSNLTYLINLGSKEYVLRRPPFGNTVQTAHDMRREYEVLLILAKLYPPAPEPFLYCDDEAVIGAEFYLMKRRRGLVLRGDAPSELAESKEMQRGVCSSFINELARLHAVDFANTRLAAIGKPEGYCQRQVVGWTQRYDAARTHEHGELEQVKQWLNERIPKETGAAVVHNDYKFDNVMLHPEDLARVTAVLDWEMVTIGDPLMDLGTTLGYWISADAGEEMMSMPFNPRVLMESVTRRELADMYQSASGRDTSDILYYYVFGTFKIAVIAQQIYARYVKGSTKDSRFANFDRFVATLGRIAAGAIERGTV